MADLLYLAGAAVQCGALLMGADYFGIAGGLVLLALATAIRGIPV